MDTVLTNITEYMLKQSCQVAILFVVVAIVCLALKKKTAHLRYLLWLLILAKCLVPSVVTISLAILPQQPKPAPIEPPAAIPLTTGTITPMEYTPIVPVLTARPPEPWGEYPWPSKAA